MRKKESKHLSMQNVLGVFIHIGIKSQHNSAEYLFLQLRQIRFKRINMLKTTKLNENKQNLRLAWVFSMSSLMMQQR